jgi:hypothetical protein
VPFGIEDVDALTARAGRYDPRWGFHDHHREADGTADYLPALMQVRAEFAALLSEIERLPQREAALQLGMGNCWASHDVWCAIFTRALTIDFGVVAAGDVTLEGMDTHSAAARAMAESFGPFDFLLIDAGHSYDDVAADWRDYGPLVRAGGLITFHDALPRATFPEVEVWKFLESIPDVSMIGTEVGIALVRR